MGKAEFHFTKFHICPKLRATIKTNCNTIWASSDFEIGTLLSLGQGRSSFISTNFIFAQNCVRPLKLIVISSGPVHTSKLGLCFPLVKENGASPFTKFRFS